MSKTKTGALPHSAGFPGSNMIRTRLHPAILHISITGEIDEEQVQAINRMAEIAYKMKFKKRNNGSTKIK